MTILTDNFQTILDQALTDNFTATAITHKRSQLTFLVSGGRSLLHQNQDLDTVRCN
jgi:hypothetical protein